MRVLFVASECYPFVKTGGLADVAAALPVALRAQGADVRVLLPGFPGVVDRLRTFTLVRRLPGLPGVDGAAARLLAATGEDGLPIYILDAPAHFDRVGNPYLAPDGKDWPDNPLRFGALAKAAALLARDGAAQEDGSVWHPEIVHGHDWQTGLVPAWLDLFAAERPAWRRPATIFTIHNLAFQGLFPPETLEALGLPESLLHLDGLEFHGKVGFLKAGIGLSDRITTVSPTYAEEIRGTEMGFGLDGLLNARAGVLSGILNGVDTGQWDPATDSLIARPFGPDEMAGKAENKAALQQAFGLDADASAPLFAVVSRLTHQKGIDLIVDALPRLVEQGGQLAVLGTGDTGLESAIAAAARAHPGRCGLRLAYDEALSHRIQAGADVLMVPSRFEPCGLTQMYALRYGTLPLVTKVGGLADTVTDVTESTLADKTATGFVFAPATLADMIRTIDRALALWRRPDLWRQVQRAAMARDVGWAGSAARYITLYREAAADRLP